MGTAYNGYTWSERMAKFKEQQRRMEAGHLGVPRGPCRLCGDPGGPGADVTFEYHDEDYSRDYRWTEPAAFIVCRDCHIYRIHQRFQHPEVWAMFLAHVARGGYARDMRLVQVQKELAQYRAALVAGNPLPDLAPRNAGKRPIEDTWFSQLTCDVNQMSNPERRPRP